MIECQQCQSDVGDTVKREPGCVLLLGVRSVSVSALTPDEKPNDFNGCQVSGVSPLRGPGGADTRPPRRRT
jgi:hypothetical protein